MKEKLVINDIGQNVPFLFQLTDGTKESNPESSKKFCGSDAPEASDTPVTHILRVYFASDSSIQHSGFRIRYKVLFAEDSGTCSRFKYKKE